MKTFALSSALVMVWVGAVTAGDLRIDFPLFLRAPAAAASSAAASSTNLQTFTGALGGATADPITSTGDPTKPFAVDGDTFSDFPSAVTRSCNNQHNACADIANSSGDKNLTVGECDTQQTQCLAAQTQVESTLSVQSASASTTTTSAEPTLKSADADFFYFCDP